MGGSPAGTEGSGGDVPATAATVASSRGPQPPRAGSLSPGRQEDPGTVAPGPVVAAAAEKLPPLPDRQGGRSSLYSRYSSGPYCLARRGDHDGLGARDGGLSVPAVRCRGHGKADPPT